MLVPHTLPVGLGMCTNSMTHLTLQPPVVCDRVAVRFIRLSSWRMKARVSTATSITGRTPRIYLRWTPPHHSVHHLKLLTLFVHPQSLERRHRGRSGSDPYHGLIAISLLGKSAYACLKCLHFLILCRCGRICRCTQMKRLNLKIFSHIYCEEVRVLYVLFTSDLE